MSESGKSNSLMSVETKTEQTNLLDLSPAAMVEFFASMGEKSFRARQMIKWIHFRGITDFDLMTDISKPLRAKLKSLACIVPPKVIFNKPSEDGTHKWLIQTPDGNCVEMVFIPEEGRGTLCVSSQVGCMLTCKFCSTGTQGFNRNLKTSEIIGQLWVAARSLSQLNGEHDRQVTNVVMMGMGEPLLNYKNVIAAMDLMLNDDAYGLSRRRVTLSTSGIVPAIYDMGRDLPVSLAVSLHAPNDTLRSDIVPINRKYPLSELMQACRDYTEVSPHKSITMEYVMLDHVNDTEACAHELVALLHDVPSKINLIPFNPFPGTDYKRSSNNRIHQFRRILQEAGFIATIRKTRGDDIDAACGQLVGQVKDRTSRQERHKRKL